VRRVPGKYQHNPDPALAELLYTVTQEGWGNDRVGDVEEDGFAASLLLVEPAEQQELTDAFDQPVPAGNFIVHEDRQGVVTVDQYPTPFHARRAFTALVLRDSLVGDGGDTHRDDVAVVPNGRMLSLSGVVAMLSIAAAGGLGTPQRPWPACRPWARS
jgi:hypothetical protein